MADPRQQDAPFIVPMPTTPSPMIGHRGAPPGAPPIPWRKYIFYVLGFPIRIPQATDSWQTPDGRPFI